MRPRVTTLFELVDESASADPDAEALVFADGERLTVGGLVDRSVRHAAALLALGVAPGDRVALLLPASADLVALLLAVTRVGAVAVPVNARYRPDEVRHVVVHSGAAVVVTAPPSTPGAPDLAELARQAVDAGPTPELRALVTLDELRGGDPAAVADVQAGTRVRDAAVLVYTSGTTAAPKGALLSHEALVRLAAGIAERMALTSVDRIWTAIPLFHGGGITFALSALTARATFVHPGFFDPATTPALLESERITVALAAFETIWMPVLDRPDRPDRDWSAIRLVMAVGVPERLRAMADRVPQAVHVSCVAMTESSAFLALGRLDDPLEARLTTGGHPMPGMSVRVVDPETGADLPPDVPGELLFRGPTAFDGYFRDPEATAATIDAHGWVHTGDVVTVDADRRVTFRTRLKDMLKVGGENVSAAEIENHLLTHPAVGVVAVVAAPDARYVEVPAAFVQLAPGASVTAEELIAHCVGRIASFRVPRYVRFVEQWPMSGTKIRKVELRARIAEELAAAGVTEAPRVGA
ncbi:AMP-dependent synthetase [Actinomycetospora sp. NBRC 106375]|uniref:class I adenylate-forming enzyme family protein n=1 Tax=Actinomycetospora sp. NBRC 106375 TaxID=3032207 RepID=UPI0024A2D5D4|nr:AMP-binding protein [Actinomycetospora sp. NBRC 106375]GLZ45382.1 AMP-dependent synthetase [Actinomycetospora sp. NBRC 106375]